MYVLESSHMATTSDFFAQYANVIIPLAVSLITAIATFFVYKEKVSNLEKEVDKLRTEVKEIRDKAIACETSLREREPLARRKSPVSLTDRGTSVLQDSGAKKFINDNFEELMRKVNESNPQTSYDVQERAREIVESLSNDVRINTMKDYLFKEGMDFSDLALVMGIYLRDKILENKGWKTEDIDKYDPNAKVTSSESSKKS